jgi:SWI/SNF-related matrix-associated actin-dependent regulator of chromatin subfamily A3
MYRAEAKGMVKQFQAGKSKNGLNMYRHVLEVLLRMRQVCCHWKLCGTRVTDLAALIESDEVVALTKENRAALQLLLQLNIESREDCPICLVRSHFSKLIPYLDLVSGLGNVQ